MQISKQYVKYFIQSIIVLLYLNVHPTYAGQPTAHPGIDQAVQKNQLQANETALDGTQSSDPENETLTYQWFGPFGTAESVKPDVIIPQGIYTVTLIVSDGHQRSAPETATIAVNACFNINARAKRNKIQLTWDNQPETQKYEIYRSDNTAPSTFRKIGETSSRYATYLDETVANDITYLYIVVAQTQAKNCYSEVASAHPSRERIYGQNYNSIIHSIPVVKAWAGIKFNYDVNGTDPNAQDKLTYTLTNAPANMVIDPDNGQISWIPEQSGDVEVSVRVNDGKDGNDYQSFTLHVSELSQLNQPPKADAGEDQTAYMAEIVYLDASNSIDPDGDPLQYTWTILDKPQGSQAELSDAHLIKPLFTIDKQGLYRIKLTVNDGAEESMPDEVTFSTINRKPVADAGQDQQGQVGNTLTLNGSNSSDEDNDPLTYQWTLTSRPQGSTATITNPGIQESSFTADIAGHYTVQLIVNDGVIDSEPATVEVDITAIVIINNPPQITTTPVINNTVETLYSYAVAASDPDLGDKLTFSLNTAPAGMSIDPESGLISWTPENPGDFQIEVRVRDIAGLTDTQQYQLQINPVIVLTEPDLSISYIDNTDTIYDGQTNTVSGKLTVTIENDSETAVNDSFKVLIFEDRDADGFYQADTDSNLGEATVTDGLNAQASKTLNITLAGSVEFSGSLLWGFIDSQDSIVEIDEANNINNSSYQCTYTPPVGQFNPVVELYKDNFFVLPDSSNVMMTPAVIDLNEDQVPEIIFSTFTGDTYTQNGILRAIRGDNGEALWNVVAPEHQVDPSAGIAVGDIDQDGQPEVIAIQDFTITDSRRLIAFEHDGTFKWVSEPINEQTGWGGPAIADLDQDGSPEIVIGATVLNSDGSVRWEGSFLTDAGHANNQGIGFGPYGVQSVITDLDLDGIPEVLAGKSAYRVDGTLYWNADITDGFPAIGNFDIDLFPELIIVSGGNLYLLQHDGSIGWGPVAIPGNTGGGAPTIADMDGDGQPEIGVAGTNQFTVFETDGSIKWQRNSRDGSSMTGSSVFDFDADGSAEIVYADEYFLRIYRGSDGTVLYELPKGSGTTYEIPIVVDVDGDGNAEVVTVANDYAYGSQNGIYIIGDANDTWVPTRKIWNQHSYHISNINDDGSIPTHEANSWETHNTYRLNSLPESASVFSAPDLIASSVNLTTNNDTVTFSARIGNGGGIVVGEGIDIAFYDGDPSSGGTLLTTTKTTARIGAGQYEDVQVTIPLTVISELWVLADDDGQGNGHVNECDELNNKYSIEISENNNPPVITSAPTLSAKQGISYQYEVKATDPDVGDVTTFSLLLAPENMSINPTTGLIQWTPNNDNSITLGNNLVGRYSFSGDASDSSGGVNHGVANNVILVDDRAQNERTAYQFNGIDSEIRLPTDIELPSTQDWTVTGWVRTTNDTSSSSNNIRNPILSNRDSNPVTSNLGVEQGRISYLHWDGGAWRKEIGGTNLADGEWHFLVWINSSEQFIDGYVDGIKELDAANSVVSNNGPVNSIGYSYGTTADAAIDDIRIYNRKLSSQEVLALYGSHSVIVKAEDTQGEYDDQAYTLYIAENETQITSAPKIISTPVLTAVSSIEYLYDVDAIDRDLGDILSYSLETSADGVMIDAQTGEIKWTPTDEQVNEYLIVVRVEDQLGLIDTQSYVLSVAKFDARDLIISSIDTSDIVFDSVNGNASGDIVALIKNQGYTAIDSGFKVIFYEDRNGDEVYQANQDSLLGESGITASLAAHSETEISTFITGSVEFAGSLVWGFVDSNNDVVESNETNNISNSSHQCSYIPQVGQFDPVVEWNKNSFSFMPESNQVMVTPAVGDLNGDDIPDIVFTTFSGSNYQSDGVLRAISGDDGRELWNVYAATSSTYPTLNLAIGDIDNDNKLEIITIDSLLHVVTYEHDGTLKWRSNVVFSRIEDIALADLDGDGVSEIVVGNLVLNNDGTLRWDGAANGGGPIQGAPIVADLDLDGTPEVIMGQNVFRADGSLYWQANVNYRRTAVGDFDNDPYPEVVGVESGGVYLLEHTGELIWGPMQVPGGGGGAPAVADMDGDGELEIGVAGADHYAVFNTDGSILWSSNTRDYSSRSTGSSVFDFDGDGKAEVIYGDELKLRIYNGIDGAVLFEMAKGSGTSLELPVIADVDNDGNAEIIAVANNYTFGNETGIFVIGDRNDTWVPTRKIWNQHSYHITNINDDGSIPVHETNSWLTHNTYRLNSFPESESVFSAPDLIASSVNLTINSDNVTLSARIGNGGGIVVGEGIDIAFYNGDPASGGTLLATTKTTARIGSGRYEDVHVIIPLITVTKLWVSVDDDGLGNGQVNECDELNNIYHNSEDSANNPPRVTSKPAPAISRLTILVANDENRSGWGVDNFSFFNGSAGIVDFEDIGLAEGGVLTNEVAGLTFQGAIIAAQGDPAYGFVSATGGDITNSGGNFFGNFVTDPVVDGSLSVSGMVEVLFEDDIFDLSFQVADIDGGETFNAKIFGPDNTLLDEIVFTVGSVNDFVTGDGDVTPIHFITPRAEVNQPYRYQVEAIDADVGDKLTFSLLSAPEGMAIDPNTGLIEWVPVNDQSGAQVVSVKVQDSVGLFDTQEYQVLVQVDNICRASIPSNLAPLLAYQFDDQNNPTENVGSLGADYDAQLSGDASFTPFEPGKAITFDGAYDYVIPGGDANLLNIADDDFSLVATIQTTTFEPEVATDSIRSIIWKEETGSNSMYVLGLRRKIGTARFALADGLNSISIEGNIPINDDRPHKLIAARSGDDLYLCVDGQLDGMTALPIGFGSTINNSQLVIGGRTIADSGGSPTTGNNDDFNGIIDDVFIFSQSIIGSTDNVAPIITSTPVTVVPEGQVYNYDVEATDPDLNDNLTYLLTTAPEGMTIDIVTGLIKWLPSSVHIGNYEVTVSVTDTQGNSDSQSYMVSVSTIQEHITINVPGFIASTCASGGLLKQPMGIRYGLDGNLYVANSSSGPGTNTPAEGNILKINTFGSQSIYSQGHLLQGPWDLYFNNNAAFGNLGELFVSLEDTNEAGYQGELIARIPVNGGSPQQFTALGDENTGLRVATTKGFGNYLYASSREDYLLPSRLFRVDSSGQKSIFTVNESGNEVTGISGLEFASGGRFGHDLYITTFDDTNDIDPSASNGIYRVDSTGTATALLQGEIARYLAFSSTIDGPFGEYLYVTDGDNGNVYRVDPDGNYSLFATGFTNAVGLDFGPDGSLCVADAITGDIIRISPDSADNFVPVITSTVITDAQAGKLYSYDVEAADPDDDLLTYELESTLFGVIANQAGNYSLVQIDTETAHTIPVFDFDVTSGYVPFSMTYHSSLRQFLFVLYSPEAAINKAPPPGAGDQRLLGVLSLDDQQFTEAQFSGLPSGELDVSGISYNPISDQVLVTFGETRRLLETRIAEIDTAGNVLAVSSNLGLGDRDNLTFDPMSGLNVGVDFNADEPRLASIADIFGTPVTATFANPPFSTNVYEPAISDDGIAFAVGLNDLAGKLVSIVNDEFQAVGEFGLVGRVRGLAFVPVPTGMSIDSATGQITWIPTTEHVGEQPVTLKVSDGHGGIDTQTYNITTVEAQVVNHQPAITSSPAEFILTGKDYSYQIIVTDQDNDPLTYILDVAPEGMSISAAGLINWPNNNNASYPVNVAITVSDGQGGSATQSWSINKADIAPPQVTLKMTSNIIELGETLQVQVEVVSSATITTTSLIVEGVLVPLNADGIATLQPQATGFYQMQASATDQYGQTGTEQRQLLVGTVGDVTYPQVDLQDGSECTDVTDLHPIIGTASDASPINYWIFRKRQGTTAWTPFASGKNSVNNAELATFDPTVLRNGIYDIQLFAYDSSGNVSKTYGCYIVDEGLKVGQVNFAQVDITIPALGIPLTIAREYDSRMLESGDFGPGWNLANKGVSATTTSPLGENWGQQKQGGGVFDEFILVEYQKHEVAIHFSDEDVLRFKMDVKPKSQFFDPLEFLAVDYLPVGNTQGTLQVYNYDRDVILQGSELTLYDAITIYNPKQFKLTRRDGSVYIIGPNGIESMTDVYGHTVTYSENGISHSSGASLSFIRGAGNRIEKITTRFGTELEYHYDAEGYLEKVIQTNESQGQRLSRILQNFQSNEIIGNVAFPDKVITHNHFSEIIGEHAIKRLTDIKAPDGTVLGQFEYDGLGRMSALVDADGNRVVYGFDVPNHKQTITDRLGNETLYEYDNKGNVTKKVDPLGHITQWEYDADGNETAVILPNGARTERTYNAAGDVLSETDALGNTAIYTYDVSGQVLSITDPLGNTNRNTYDALGNLTQSTDALGTVTGQFTYDADGNMSTTTDVTGLSRKFSYDAAGNQISSAFDWVNPNDPSDIRPVTTNTSFDTQGRVLSATDQRAQTTTNLYDAIGQLLKSSQDDSIFTSSRYNQLGKVIEASSSDGTIVRSVYDDQGRLWVQTDRFVPGASLPRGRRMSYDAEGRVIKTERIADINILVEDATSRAQSTGTVVSTTSNTYDELGRVLSSIGALGEVTSYEYDDVGNRTAVVAPLGNRTEFEYDLAGHQIRVRDPLGRETQFVYDKAGQRVRTLLVDGTETRSEYDLLGHRVVEIDQAGRQRNFWYDSAGRLTSVELSAVPDSGSSNVLTRPRFEYVYGLTGTLQLIRDAKGRETRFTYDQFNQRLSRTLPLGQTETSIYNTNGTLDRKADFNGQVTEFGYDNLRRMVEKRLYAVGSSAPEETVLYNYDDLGRQSRLTDLRGTTTFTYDSEGNTTQVSSPEGTINYEYDSVIGLQTRTYTDHSDTRYGYDRINRLQTVTVIARNGIPLNLPEVTAYSYTAFGTPDETILANGVTSRHNYDILGRLTNLSHTSPDNTLLGSYGYTLTADGIRKGVVESQREINGALRQGTISYTYDELNRLTGEIQQDAAANEIFDTQYVYDLVGNRLQREITAAGQTLTTDYSYDDNDRLLTETHVVTGTPTGIFPRDISLNDWAIDGADTTYVYDDNGALISKVINGPKPENWEYHYNLEGRLAESVRTFNEGGQTIVVTSTYLYNQHGIRVRKQTEIEIDGISQGAETQVFLVDELNPTGYAQVLEEYDGINVEPVTTFSLGSDVLTQARADNGGLPEQLMYDGHGSTRALLDGVAGVVDGYDYEAYGVRLGNSTNSEVLTSLLYTGEEFDKGLGEYYLRARYYNSSLGRFGRVDPYFGQSVDPQTLHRYGYVEQRPTVFVDPSGQYSLVGAMQTVGVISLLLEMSASTVSGDFDIAYIAIEEDIIQTVIETAYIEMESKLKGRFLLALEKSAINADNKLAQFLAHFERSFYESKGYIVRVDYPVKKAEALAMLSRPQVKAFSFFGHSGLSCGVDGSIGANELKSAVKERRFDYVHLYSCFSSSYRHSFNVRDSGFRGYNSYASSHPASKILIGDESFFWDVLHDWFLP